MSQQGAGSFSGGGGGDGSAGTRHASDITPPPFDVVYDEDEYWEEGEDGGEEYIGVEPSRSSGHREMVRTPRSTRLSRQRRELTKAAAGGIGVYGNDGVGGVGGLGSSGAFSPNGGIARGGGIQHQQEVMRGLAAARPYGMEAAGVPSGGDTGGNSSKMRHIPATPPADFFLDEEAEMSRHPFPIPPHELITRARGVLAEGVAKWPDLSDNFEFTAPFIGPLSRDDFRSMTASLALEEAFPGIEFRYHHFRVDPFRPNRVWVTLQPRCTHTGTFRGKLPFGIGPTGKVIEEPPQTASLTFNADGQVEGYTTGYVMDRKVGNTNGLGGVFGLMWALGAPLPAPEGHPWSPSLQLRLVNSGVWLLQAVAYIYDRTVSLFLPSSWLARHSRNTM